jgi:hypothetical protein
MMHAILQVCRVFFDLAVGCAGFAYAYRVWRESKPPRLADPAPRRAIDPQSPVRPLPDKLRRRTWRTS